MTVGKYDVEFYDVTLPSGTRGVGVNVIEYSSNDKELGRKSFMFDNSYTDVNRYLKSRVYRVQELFGKPNGSVLKLICGVYPVGSTITV